MDLHRLNMVVSGSSGQREVYASRCYPGEMVERNNSGFDNRKIPV